MAAQADSCTRCGVRPAVVTGRSGDGSCLHVACVRTGMPAGKPARELRPETPENPRAARIARRARANEAAERAYRDGQRSSAVESLTRIRGQINKITGAWSGADTNTQKKLKETAHTYMKNVAELLQWGGIAAMSTFDDAQEPFKTNIETLRLSNDEDKVAALVGAARQLELIARELTRETTSTYNNYLEHATTKDEEKRGYLLELRNYLGGQEQERDRTKTKLAEMKSLHVSDNELLSALFDVYDRALLAAENAWEGANEGVDETAANVGTSITEGKTFDEANGDLYAAVSSRGIAAGRVDKVNELKLKIDEVKASVEKLEQQNHAKRNAGVYEEILRAPVAGKIVWNPALQQKQASNPQDSLARWDDVASRMRDSTGTLDSRLTNVLAKLRELFTTMDQEAKEKQLGGGCLLVFNPAGPRSESVRDTETVLATAVAWVDADETKTFSAFKNEYGTVVAGSEDVTKLDKEGPALVSRGRSLIENTTSDAVRTAAKVLACLASWLTTTGTFTIKDQEPRYARTTQPFRHRGVVIAWNGDSFWEGGRLLRSGDSVWSEQSPPEDQNNLKGWTLFGENGIGDTKRSKDSPAPTGWLRRVLDQNRSGNKKMAVMVVRPHDGWMHAQDANRKLDELMKKPAPGDTVDALVVHANAMITDIETHLIRASPDFSGVDFPEVVEEPFRTIDVEFSQVKYRPTIFAIRSVDGMALECSNIRMPMEPARMVKWAAYYLIAAIGTAVYTDDGSRNHYRNYFEIYGGDPKKK